MCIRKTFWRRVAFLRSQKWISQEVLGSISKIHRTYISEIERWETNISLDHIERLAIAFEISLSELFDTNELCS